MKTKLPLLLCILLPLTAHAATDLSTALQKGLFEEEANQNLPAAIQAYQSLLAASDEQRKLAATALFRLGECYRKLGQTNDAVAQYQRLISDFSDQSTLTTLSRQNLRGLGVSLTIITSGNDPRAVQALSSEARARIKELLQAEIEIAARLAVEQRKKVEAGALASGEDVRFERDVLGLMRQLVAVDGLASAEDRHEWRKLLVQEIVLAERAVSLERKKMENGKSTASEVARLQRDVLILKRESLADENTPQNVSTGPVLLPTSIEEQELARTERILAQLSGLDFSQARRLLPTLVPDGDSERYEKLLVDAQERVERATGEEKERWVRKLDQFRVRLMQRFDEIKQTLEERVAQLRSEVAKQSAQTSRETSRAGAAQAATAGLRAEAVRADALLKQLQSMNRSEVIRVLPTVAPDELLNSLLEKRAQAERDLATLKVSFASTHPDVKTAETTLKNLHEQIAERVEGIMKGLAIKAAALKQQMDGTTAAAAPIDEEDQEIRRIQAIIKDSPDLINAPNVEVTRIRSGELMVPRNGTLLHKAASLGQRRVATFLLDHGADISARDQSPSQNTPLHWAALNGHRAMVELLLSRKADPNAILIPDGSTPLLLATRKSFRSVCEALLARGANPNLPDAASETPLDAAASRGDEAIVRLLLDKGAEVNRKSKSGTTPLHRTSSTNTVRLLLERGAEVNAQDEQGRSPLFGAAERDQRELLELLLAQKADAKLADKIGWTPFHAAANAGAASVIAPLIQNGADPNQQDGSKRVPLDYVVRSTVNGQPAFVNYPETLKALLAGGANPNPPGDKVSTLLYRAVAAGYEQMAEMLLKAGANPNVKMDTLVDINNPGMTPLLRALYSNNNNPPPLSMVSLLLDHKADPNLKTDNSYGPVHWVLASGRERVLETLLSHGADPDARNGDGEIPLGRAAEIGSKETVALLLKYKADPNGKSHQGRTPLHIAVAGGKRDLVDLLLAANANPNATDEKGLSPLDYVKPKARQDAASADMAEKLRKAGALDWAPRPNQITITRRGRSFSQAVFQRGTNTWNNHTLFELIASAGFCAKCPELAFPDFSNIRISRVAPGANQMSDTTVDVLGGIALGDCRANVPLQWGDLVEIPEIEHKRNESWTGLTEDFAKGIAKCLERNVFIIVKGQQYELPLKARTVGTGVFGVRTGNFQFDLSVLRLNTAVLGSSHVLSSSDLTNVRVSRPKDPQYPNMGYLGTPGFNLEDKASPAAEFWLREGDKIVVPEKGANTEPSPLPTGGIQPNVSPLRSPPTRSIRSLPVLPPPVPPEPK